MLLLVLLLFVAAAGFLSLLAWLPLASYAKALYAHTTSDNYNESSSSTNSNDV